MNVEAKIYVIFSKNGSVIIVAQCIINVIIVNCPALNSQNECEWSKFSFRRTIFSVKITWIVVFCKGISIFPEDILLTFTKSRTIWMFYSVIVSLLLAGLDVPSLSMFSMPSLNRRTNRRRCHSNSCECTHYIDGS